MGDHTGYTELLSLIVSGCPWYVPSPWEDMQWFPITSLARYVIVPDNKGRDASFSSSSSSHGRTRASLEL